MQYVISFLEGIITFISPCLLPMLPIYISYFAGGGERSAKKTLTGALGFVTGFTLVFMAMGALAGTVGSFLSVHQTWVNVISGLGETPASRISFQREELMVTSAYLRSTVTGFAYTQASYGGSQENTTLLARSLS